MRSRAFRIGPADHDEFLAVEALGLDPEPAVAGHVGRIGAFRDDAFEPERAGLCIKLRAPARLMIAVLQRRADTGKKGGKASLALNKRQWRKILAVEIEAVEQKK